MREAREGTAPWRKWGTYLSERRWGTVREDTVRAARRGTIFRTIVRVAARIVGAKDGLAGLCDEKQRLWERAFGLTNTEGNHSEDVKELFLS